MSADIRVLHSKNHLNFFHSFFRSSYLIQPHLSFKPYKQKISNIEGSHG
jgi:hypothetical protein